MKKSGLAVIKKYLQPYKKAILLTAVFALLENGLAWVMPILYGKIVDSVIATQSFGKDVLILLLTWFGVEIGSILFYMWKTRRAHKIAFRASTDVLLNSVEHLVSLPMSFHKNRKVGELVQRFARADGYMYTLVSQGLFEILPNLLMSFAAFIVIWLIKWELAAIYVVFILLFVWLTITKTNPIIDLQKKLNKIFEKAYGNIFDRNSNVINIKANTAEKLESERNREIFSEGFRSNDNQIILWNILSLWQSLTFAFGFLALFVLGIYFITLDKITIGQFVMLLTYINLLSNAVNGLGGQYKQFQESVVTIGRAYEIFNEESENYDDPKGLCPQEIRGEIAFEDVHFFYEKQKVLNGINFKIGAGKTVAIVGKSGEGKSTLVDLISRYNCATQGRVLLDGINVKKINLRCLRNQIAIVPQDIALFNDTIKNNIAYSKIGASDAEVEKAAQMANCHEFIEKFPKKYAQMVGERGVQLSVGQKQRVALARAILRNPKILILDEATSALDSQSEKYVQEALETVMQNRTTFVIAHRLSTIRKADLILVIENGKIIESGDHAELMNRGGVYRSLSELQQINF